ncbi:MAG: LiaF transmembrane domain-containing protein [Candidatus Kryptoniota bacterium]
MMVQTGQVKIRLGRIFIGLLLLVTGVLLLLNRAGVMNINLLAVVGAVALVVGGERAITGYAASEQKKLFWGTFVFLTGFLMILVNYEVVPSGWDSLWPSVLIIPGLSFLMLYFSKPKEVLFLIISIVSVLAGWGGLVAMRENYDLTAKLFTTLRVLVPAAIIFAGFYLLWKNFLKKGT